MQSKQHITDYNINNHQVTYMQQFQYGFYIWFYIYIYIYMLSIYFEHIFLFLALHEFAIVPPTYVCKL